MLKYLSVVILCSLASGCHNRPTFNELTEMKALCTSKGARFLIDPMAGMRCVVEGMPGRYIYMTKEEMEK